MRNAGALLLGLLILVPMVCAVPAPEPSGPRPRGLVPIFALLLQRPQVQEELRLSQEQREKIAEADRKYREGLEEMLRDRPADPRQRRLELGAAQQEAITRILTVRQRGRAEQLTLQYLGPAAFTRPAVASALELSAEQQDKMKAIRAEISKEMWGSTPEKGKTRRELTQLRNEKMMSVLTAAQKEKWKVLTGPPFAEIRPDRTAKPAHKQ